MSPLMVVLSTALASAACSGSETEVPVRIVGWEEADRAWLEQELARWMGERERTLCEGGPGLFVELGAQEVAIQFTFKGALRTRSLPRAGPVSELFRYETAATAEELVRSTWEAPPPPRFGLLARGAVFPLGAGPVFGGGSLGVALYVLAALSLEAHVSATPLFPFPVGEGGELTGGIFGGIISVSWLALRLGVFRLGPRASVQVGLLQLAARGSEGFTFVDRAPWVWLGGGASTGVEFRRFSVLLVGEVGAAVSAMAVLSEGVPVVSLRGFSGALSLQLGVTW